MKGISVIIPVYNRQDTIIDALDSVKNQTSIKEIIQIIVVDDGSSDNSIEIIEKYMSDNPELPIELYKQKNGGASVARNTGLKNAKGEWIAFLDSDDEWLPNKIKRQLEVISSTPEIDFLGTGCDDIPLRILFKKIDNLYKASVNDLVVKCFPCTPTILMRKKIFDEIGGFDEHWRYAEDGEYFTRICLNYNYYYLPESHVKTGHGKRSFGENGLSSNLKAMYEGNINIIKRLRKEKNISTTFYITLRLFYFLKYIRRIVITTLAKKEKRVSCDT